MMKMPASDHPNGLEQNGVPLLASLRFLSILMAASFA
jgi:hypothetical protein